MISDNVEEARQRRQGRELGQGLRARPRREREERRARSSTCMATVQGIKDLGHVQLDGTAERQHHARSRGVRALRPEHGRRRGGRPGGHRRQAVTQVYEGEKRFDLTVRWLEPYRTRSRRSARSRSRRPPACTIPLGQIAEISARGRPERHLPRGRAALRAGEVQRARARPREHHRRGAAARSRENVHLPYDSHLEWAGEINQLNEAMDRLKLILPLTLLLIAFLVYSAVKNWVDTLIVFYQHPGRERRRASSRSSSPACTSRCRRRWGSSRSSASPCRTPSSS